MRDRWAGFNLVIPSRKRMAPGAVLRLTWRPSLEANEEDRWIDGWIDEIDKIERVRIQHFKLFPPISQPLI